PARGRAARMHPPEPEHNLQPGRYAAIDVGTNSVLLLIADVGRDGRLETIAEDSQITRLGENVSATRTLSAPAIKRTLQVVRDYVDRARLEEAGQIAIVGTAVLREAQNGADFCHLVRAKCGVPVEVITGDQEAELAWRAQEGDPALGPPAGPRVVLDIGG